MRVLHVTPSFFPATRWGGPIFSTKAICDWISTNRDVDLRVLTTDAAGPLREERIPLENKRVRASAGYEVVYHTRNFGHSVSIDLLSELPSAVLWSDVVHLSTTYSFPTLPTLTLARLLRRPVVWSLRGAVQASAEWSGAPRRHSKLIFERVASFLSPRQTVVHVTANSEAEITRLRLPRLQFATIPNSVDVPEQVQAHFRDKELVRLMYLGRLHEKKGLSILVRALSALPKYYTLDVYGDGETGYVNSLKAEIASLELGERVHFHGHVDGEAKRFAFSHADIFVLPSYSENFGIVVAEALAHGLPVLTTHRTPWSDLDSRGCGKCVSPDVESLKTGIEYLSGQDLVSMGVRGRNWMRNSFSPGIVHSAMYELYESLVHSHARN